MATCTFSLLQLISIVIQAEEATKAKGIASDTQGILPNTDKKRKRTSIAAPEKRLLEDYFR